MPLVYLRHCTEKSKLNTIFTEWYRETNFETRSKITVHAQVKTMKKT